VSKTAYIIVLTKVTDPRAWFAGVEADEGSASLVDMSSAFKKNFISAFGTVLKHRKVTDDFQLDGIKLTLTDIISLPVLLDASALDVRYNTISVIRVIDHTGVADLTNVEARLIRELAAHQNDWLRVERDGDKIKSLFRYQEITSALDSALTISGSRRLAADVRTYEEVDENILCSMSIQAFYTFAGSCLVSIEALQSDLSVEDVTDAEYSEIVEEIYALRLMLANFNRMFMTSSQSYSTVRREFCEMVSNTYRLRERLAWHNSINGDYETIAVAAQAKAQRRSADLLGTILFVLTIFTVFSGTFFGVFSLNPEAEVIRNGLRALVDSRYILPIFLSCSALVAALGASWLWSRLRSKR